MTCKPSKKHTSEHLQLFDERAVTVFEVDIGGHGDLRRLRQPDPEGVEVGGSDPVGGEVETRGRSGGVLFGV